MEKVLELKIQQNEDIYIKLLNTGLRPIIEYIKEDDFMYEKDELNKNIVGNILTKLRNKYYEDF